MHIQTAFRATESGLPGRLGDSGAIAAGAKAPPFTFYPAGSLIYAQGDVAGPLYEVEFGTIRLCRIAADGRRQITGFLQAGEVFGFEAAEEHSSYAESVDGAGVRVLRITQGEGHASSVFQLALQTLARMQQQLMVLGCRSANVRMAAFLLDLSERQQDNRQVHLAMQRVDIADYLGITFETVSRSLRFLQDEGLVRLRTTTEIEIVNRDALAHVCA